MKRTRATKNNIRIVNGYCLMDIYNINHEVIAKTKFDKKFKNKVLNHKWHITRNGYIKSTISKNGKKIGDIYLHQFILGKKEGYIIDHINRDRLDNRLANLRHCTHLINNRNSKAIGVYWSKHRKKWIPSITVNYKNIYLGGYVSKFEAIKVRKDAAKKYFNT